MNSKLSNPYFKFLKMKKTWIIGITFGKNSINLILKLRDIKKYLYQNGNPINK
jgi:hypothetical protein